MAVDTPAARATSSMPAAMTSSLPRVRHRDSKRCHCSRPAPTRSRRRSSDAGEPCEHRPRRRPPRPSRSPRRRTRARRPARAPSRLLGSPSDSMSMSLRPSPTATVRRATPSRSRNGSSALALVTPAGATSIHAVQPIAYVTSASPTCDDQRVELVGGVLRAAHHQPCHVLGRAGRRSRRWCARRAAHRAGRAWFIRKPTPISSTANRRVRQVRVQQPQRRVRDRRSPCRPPRTRRATGRRSGSSVSRSSTPPSPCAMPSLAATGRVAVTERPVASTTWCPASRVVPHRVGHAGR